MATINFVIDVYEYKNGVPTLWEVKFTNGEKFNAVFESKELAVLGAQLYEMTNYNYGLWMNLFPPTLRMWGIGKESEWSKI